MKIVQCEHGHYYNSEKFETCPHCQAINNEAESSVVFSPGPSVTELENTSSAKTVGMDEQKTVPIKDTLESPYDDIIIDYQPETPPAPQEQPKVVEPVTPPVQPVYVPQQPIQQVQQAPAQTIPPQQPIQGTTLEDLMRKAREQRNIQDSGVTVSLNESERIVNPTVGWLIGVNNDYYGVCFELRSGKNFIGRNYDMDVVLESDMSVSRNRHAIIIYEPRARMFIAQPGESRELFYLNDDVVLQNEILKPYDILSIGTTKLMFFPLCGDKFSWKELNK